MESYVVSPDRSKREEALIHTQPAAFPPLLGFEVIRGEIAAGRQCITNRPTLP